MRAGRELDGAILSSFRAPLSNGSRHTAQVPPIPRSDRVAVHEFQLASTRSASTRVECPPRPSPDQRLASPPPFNGTQLRALVVSSRIFGRNGGQLSPHCADPSARFASSSSFVLHPSPDDSVCPLWSTRVSVVRIVASRG